MIGKLCNLLFTTCTQTPITLCVIQVQFHPFLSFVFFNRNVSSSDIKTDLYMKYKIAEKVFIVEQLIDYCCIFTF